MILEETNENEELNIRHFFFFSVLVLSNPLWVNLTVVWAGCAVPLPLPLGTVASVGIAASMGGGGSGGTPMWSRKELQVSES